MEKIERYLDQACHGVAGPRALRAHIRQELKEHLLDAIAQHKNAGMSDDDALSRALEDFGGPDLVRSELEATHGHRLMTVILDKALQWKENTMKARWLWTSWAYIALGLTAVFEIVFLTGVPIFLLPKYRDIFHDGWIGDGPDTNGIVLWSKNFLTTLNDVATLTPYVLIATVVFGSFSSGGCGVRIKHSCAFSALGTITAGLMVPVIFTGAALTLPFLVALSPANVFENAERHARDDLAALDGEVIQLDRGDAERAAILPWHNLDAAAIILSREQTQIASLRTRLQEVRAAVREIRDASSSNDKTRVNAALQKFHAAYDPIRQFANVESSSTEPH